MAPTPSDIEAMLNAAIPVLGVDGDFNSDELLSILSGYRVIGLGEATHGDATSFLLKRALISALVSREKSVIIAWERTPMMLLFDQFVRGGAEAALDEIGLIYPWVYDEVWELMLWLRTHNSSAARPVRLSGVDMEAPPLPFALREFTERYTALEGFADTFVDGLREPDLRTREWCETLAAAIDAASTAALSVEDLLLLRTARQWLENQRVGREPGQALSGPSRDSSMAANLAWITAHDDATVIYWAHNGHVCRYPGMAGSHLGELLPDGYLSVGVAFGNGSYVAGSPDPDRGFDPHLRVHSAQAPAANSLEELLAAVGLPAYALDVRPFRCGSHALAQEQTLRQVTLAGGVDEFSVQAVPANIYDVIIWIDRARPATVIPSSNGAW
jgi:erythromycin esterase